MKWSTRTPIVRYFYETLSGLFQLHQRGIVNTCIHPGSLLIVAKSRADSDSLPDEDGTEAVLCPLRTAKKLKDRVYVAPEVWEDVDNLNTPEADIWALAASFLLGLLNVPDKGRFKVTAPMHQTIQTSIRDKCQRGAMSEPLAALMLRMLAWDPRDRPTAGEALDSEAWLLVREEKQRAEDGRKRKRQERMQPASDGEKRVRVISPEVDA
ncbi:kinase-like domain-containing protein [Trichoderma austrokoningii]